MRCSGCRGARSEDRDGVKREAELRGVGRRCPRADRHDLREQAVALGLRRRTSTVCADRLVQTVLLPLGRSSLKQGLHNLWNPPVHPYVHEAISVIRKYAPGEKQVALFLNNNLTLEVFRRMMITNAFPVANMSMDDQYMRLLGMDFYRHELKPGDYLFVRQDLGNAYELEKDLLGKLDREFRRVHVETTPQGVTVYRLDRNPDSAEASDPAGP